MSETITQSKLPDGTLIRHKVAGYEGRIDGFTQIKTCFTAGGAPLDKSHTKHIFQYRVAVAGESMRRIAPAEDLEILEGVAEVVCPTCGFSFKSKPGVAGKPAGRCECGGWICPSCLDCRDASQQAGCAKQGKRLAKKVALQKKARGG